MELYADVDALGDLKAELEARTGETLRPAPKMGDFNVRAVMDSPYFFA